MPEDISTRILSVPLRGVEPKKLILELLTVQSLYTTCPKSQGDLAVCNRVISLGLNHLVTVSFFNVVSNKVHWRSSNGEPEFVLFVAMSSTDIFGCIRNWHNIRKDGFTLSISDPVSSTIDR